MNRTISPEPQAAEYQAFPLARDAGPEAMAEAAAPALGAEATVLRDWFAGLLEAGGAHRRFLPGADGAPRHVTALLLGDGAARRHLLLTLRDPWDPAVLFTCMGSWVEAERLDATARTGGTLSHSVNNALTAILGNADYLAEVAGLPEVAKEATSLILKASERLEALMRRVSRLSRAVRPPEGASEPGAVLRALVEHRRAGLPDGIRLDVAQGPDLGMLFVDSQFLEAVLGEAVTNSVAALGETGQIRIAATLAPGEAWPGFRWLAISVRDDGPGFPEAWLPACGRDVSARAVQARGGSSYPLGLAILRGFADAMGGTLAAENLPEGGCRLVLHLPVLTEAASR
jgi:signal transduction histidine kinase